MREANFNTEVTNSLKANGWFAYKIPDTPTSMLRGMRYTPEKPCDIIASVKGKFTAIESKQIKKFECVSLKDFREGQIESLDKVLADGGNAWAFINLRISSDQKYKRLNMLIGLNWKTWGQKFKDGYKIGAKEWRFIVDSHLSNKFHTLGFDIEISDGYKGLFDVSFLT